MVNIEAAGRVAPRLLSAGKHWLLEAIHSVTRHVEIENEDKHSENQPQQASTEYLVYNWLESLFAWFQVIILWHEPFISLCAITGLLTSFLLLTCFAPSFYATIMIALFAYNLNRYWFRHIWPDIRVPPSAEREAEMRLDVDRFTYLHPQLMTLTELGQHLENLIVLGEKYLFKLLLLRQRRPIAFCSLVCTSLSCTAYIGNRVSGFSLIFSILALVLTAPGIYHRVLPEFSKQWLKKNFKIVIHKINNIDFPEEPVTMKETQSSLAKHGQQEDDSMTNAKTGDVELLASSIASSTKAQALSLFEHFKRRGFSLISPESYQAEELEPSHGNRIDQQHQLGVLATAVPTPTIDVPRNNDQDEHQSDELVSEQSRLARRHHNNDRNQENYQDEDQCSRPELRGGDFSSNTSSVSLIDSDDEQQDGFVLL